MNEQSNPRKTTSSVRWTEDRVERLLLSVFADPSGVNEAASLRPARRNESPRLVIALVAASLALTIPLFRAVVNDPAGRSGSTLARWIGPPVDRPAPTVDLALSEEPELSADSADLSSVGETDETAEAPGTTESEDSAST